MRALVRRSPIYYGWVILGTGIVANAVSAGATFWVVTIYIPVVSDDFGVDRFPVVFAFAFGQTVSALIGPLIGRYIDRRGARGPLFFGAVLVPVGLLLTAQSTEVWQLFVGWGLVSAARALIMPIPYNWLLTRWFEGRRRQATLGVVTVGFGLGGAVVLPLLKLVESQSGWQGAMVASALLVFVVHGAGALIVANRPGDVGLTLDRSRGAGTAAGDEPDWGFTAGAAMRTWAFWMVSLGLMLFFTGQGSVATLAFDFFNSEGVAGATAIIAIGAIIRTVARLPLGLLMSRIDRVFGLAMIVSVTQAIALGVLLTSTGGTGIALYLVFWGLGGAFAPMLEPLLINKAFGVRHFGAVSGTVALVSFGGQMFGTIGGARLFDATQSYQIPFALYAIGFLLAMLLFAASSLAVRSRAHRLAAEASGRGGAERPGAR